MISGGWFMFGFSNVSVTSKTCQTLEYKNILLRIKRSVNESSVSYQEENRDELIKRAKQIFIEK